MSHEYADDLLVDLERAQRIAVALEQQVAAVERVMADYAESARIQRGCYVGCGCTDCEMAEEFRSALHPEDQP